MVEGLARGDVAFLPRNTTVRRSIEPQLIAEDGDAVRSGSSARGAVTLRDVVDEQAVNNTVLIDGNRRI